MAEIRSDGCRRLRRSVLAIVAARSNFARVICSCAHGAGRGARALLAASSVVPTGLLPCHDSELLCRSDNGASAAGDFLCRGTDTARARIATARQRLASAQTRWPGAKPLASRESQPGLRSGILK